MCTLRGGQWVCASRGWKLFRSSKRGCWQSWLHTDTSVKCTQVSAAKLSSVQAVIPWFLNRVPIHLGWRSVVHTCLEASLGNLCAGETITNCLSVVVGSWMPVGRISLWSVGLTQVWNNQMAWDRGCLRHLPQLALLLHVKLVLDVCSFTSLGCCNAFLKCFRNPAPSVEPVPVLSVCQLSCHAQTQ